ncbi:tetratricopeptide repeat protein [Streptomyces sp. NPDC102274]|uniref:tetratricopeptide repeat protein n=1 Tax=Streptomyces sp. NPDC102274 TaxID=3366151 RepID=UPI003820A697
MSKSSNDFLYHYSRIPRSPLALWSERLIEFLRRGTPPESDERAKVISSLSNAALVFAYLGDLDKARKICEAQLFWIATQAEGLPPKRSANLLRLALDPWVNMGRLLGFKGETKRAVAHFSDIYSINSGSEVRLGPCRLTPQVWAVILDGDPDMKGVPRAVYVIDSLKAFFQVRDSHGALEFISSLKCVEHAGIRSLVNEGELIPYSGLHYLVYEGMIIAKSRLGRHGDVLASTTNLPTGVDMYYQVVMMLYAMESRLVLGQETTGLVRKLAVLVIGGAFDSIPPTTMLRFIEKYADLLERLEESELALGVYVQGIRLARSIDDQLSEWTFLRSLVRLGVCSEEWEEWKFSYGRLVTDCEYGVVRRVEGEAPSPSRPGSVYEKLLEVVKDLTGATAILT